MRVSSIRIGSVSREFVPGIEHTVAQAKRIPPVVGWLFLLFVFSLPYESAGLFEGSSLVKIPGFLFVAGYFVLYALMGKRFAHPNIGFMWFALYAFVFELSLLLDPREPSGLINSSIQTLIQLLVLFLLTSDLARDQKMAARLLLVYALGTAVLAVVVQIPGLSDVNAGRASVFGDNPNSTGQHMSLSVLIMIGLLLNKSLHRLGTKIIILPLTVALIAGMAITGSRAAIGGLMVGASTFLLPHWRSRRILMTAVLLVVGVSEVFMVLKSPEFADRLTATVYEGESAGRDIIYASAIEMISERPIWGWHPITAFRELGRRVGYWGAGRDVHNLFLDLLIGLGIIGAIPFLMGVAYCLFSAWKARAGSLGMLPFALIVSNLVADLSHTNLLWKPQWFFLALACAAARQLPNAKKPATIVYAR